jgi:hypothetical protein
MLSYNLFIRKCQKIDEQDQQGKATFNERNPYTTQQQGLVGRNPGGSQTKTGQSKLILLDFSKPFDMVNLAKLLYKLHFYGKREVTLHWIF